MFSKYEVYPDVGSLYCYKDSHALRNRYSIRDFEKLKAAEQDIVGAKQQYLLTHPIAGRFTVTHLRNIHRFLFEDIYPFAGHFRRETIEKGNTTFLNKKDISFKLGQLLGKLKQEQYLSQLPYEAFLERLSYYLSELNYIHPFREGNGRSTREFMRMLIERNGYTVNWTAAGVEPLMEAMIESVYDSSIIIPVLRECVKSKK